MTSFRTLKFWILVLLTVVVIGILYWNTGDDRLLRLSTTQPDISHPPHTNAIATNSSITSVLTQPRYTGEDTAGRRWEIVADKAVQRGSAGEAWLDLSAVIARWMTQKDEFIITAPLAHYGMGSQTLILTGGVHGQGGGISLTTPAAQGDIAQKQLGGKDGIIVQSSFGRMSVTLTAKAFTVDAHANRLSFTGHVHTVITE